VTVKGDCPEPRWACKGPADLWGILDAEPYRKSKVYQDKAVCDAGKGQACKYPQASPKAGPCGKDYIHTATAPCGATESLSCRSPTNLWGNLNEPCAKGKVHQSTAACGAGKGQTCKGPTNLWGLLDEPCGKGMVHQSKAACGAAKGETCKSPKLPPPSESCGKGKVHQDKAACGATKGEACKSPKRKAPSSAPITQGEWDGHRHEKKLKRRRTN
jgi:hypothetical protein